MSLALRPVVPMAALSVGVFLEGIAGAALLPVRTTPAPAAPAPVAARAPEAVQTDVPPTVAPPDPIPAAAYSPAEPATWSSRQVELVFPCVQATDLGTAVTQAQSGVGGVVVMGRPTDAAALTGALAGVRAAGRQGIAPLVASDEEGGRGAAAQGAARPAALCRGDGHLAGRAHRADGAGPRRGACDRWGCSSRCRQWPTWPYPAATPRPRSARSPQTPPGGPTPPSPGPAGSSRQGCGVPSSTGPGTVVPPTRTCSPPPTFRPCPRCRAATWCRSTPCCSRAPRWSWSATCAARGSPSRACRPR